MDRARSHLPAGAALLHDFCPVEARQLAESVITVHYRPFHDLSIPQEETGFWTKHKQNKQKL